MEMRCLSKHSQLHREEEEFIHSFIYSSRLTFAFRGEPGFIQGRIDVSNSFAVPFEEDPKDDSVWFLDHDFLENMFRMHAKVNVNERIVGFYSTGPKLRANDLALDYEIRTRYCNKVNFFSLFFAPPVSLQVVLLIN